MGRGALCHALGCQTPYSVNNAHNDPRFVLGCRQQQFHHHNLITIRGQHVAKYVQPYAQQLKLFDLPKD